MWKPEQYIPDRGIGPSGAQMLSNLRLTQPALSMQSPLRDSLVHLNISGCQSINKSAIDILLRLSHSHLPKLQRIDMAGLRLELCQEAAKSFLREKLGALDSPQNDGSLHDRTRQGVGLDLSAKHLLLWLRRTRRKPGKKYTWPRLYPTASRGDPQSNRHRTTPTGKSPFITRPIYSTFPKQAGSEWKTAPFGSPNGTVPSQALR